MELSGRYICCSCVKEPFLREAIKRENNEAYCFYCGHEEKCIKISVLADKIEQAFEDHYVQTPTEPDGYEYALTHDEDIAYEWERKGDEVRYVIADAAGIEESVADDILRLLEESHHNPHKAEVGEECPFAQNSYYMQQSPDCQVYHRKWLEFETHLKSETRFFSEFAQKTLDELFANIETLTTRAGTHVVRIIGPETKISWLYRARVFQSRRDDFLKDAIAYPWKGLGPPPSATASAGRMNARGISVFYGSTTIDTAIAEVRPPVGSRVAVAKFDVIRPLRLLDVSALEEIYAKGSVFDADYIVQLQRAQFLGHLSRRITRPVMPDDEVFDYLPTQAIADYLASLCKLDGIIFHSVQVREKDKLNIVLFHHAAAVEEPEQPKGMAVHVSLESHDDEASPEYNVWETVPSGEEKPELAESGHLKLRNIIQRSEEIDFRPSSLRVDLDKITMHHIEAVSFKSQGFGVKRYRSAHPEKDFF